MRTGCFTGDTPGYPVTLSQPGSYRLTGNLVQLNAAGTVTSRASYNNTAIGISARGGSVVRFSTRYGNGNLGIWPSAGSRAIGNTIRNNSGLGLALGDNGGYREDVLTPNNGAAETQVGIALVKDTIFNLGSNVCGTDTVCPRVAKRRSSFERGDQSSMHQTEFGKLHWIAETSQGHAAPGVPQLERSAAWLPFWPIVPLVQPVQDT